MRKIANFILGTIVCLTVLGIIMFFTLYISLIIANENPPSDDAMFRMIKKTYGVDVTQYSPDVLYKSYDTNIREDYWAMLLNINTSNNDELGLLRLHIIDAIKQLLVSSGQVIVVCLLFDRRLGSASCHPLIRV